LTRRYTSEPWRKVDIEAIAKECGLSYHWFEHAFSDHFGLAPYQYVKALRLARARGLMAAGPTERIRNVGDIALAAGYADASHMHRDFRQQQGLRPGVLAKAMHPGWRSPKRSARADAAEGDLPLPALCKAG
jgi:AraC-like DNA-binding protein